mgnify:CR=1 FL=1
MFLPDCCNKCGCSCSFLPYTITASFAKFDAKMGAEVARGFAKSCHSSFGQGAAIGISAPGGEVGDASPVTKAFVTLPGSCYAEQGRVAPTLSVFSASPKANFTIETTEFVSQCRPAWKVSSIKVTNGGDLANSSLVYVSKAARDVEVSQAVGIISQAGGETTVTLQSAGEYHRKVIAERDIPIISATATGGVRLRPTVSFNGEHPSTWSVSELSILYAGDGLEGDKSSVSFSLGDRTKAVGENLAEAYITIENGKATAAVVTSGGLYYRDTDVPPLVADVTFSSTSRLRPTDPLPAGAVLRGVVDDDPASKTFGHVIGVDVEEGGDNYRGWAWTPPRCITELNDRSITLKAFDSTPLVRTCVKACFGSGGEVEPIFRKMPRMIGSVEGLGEVADIYLEKNDGYPETWGVSRVEGFAGPFFEVGQTIKVGFVSPLPPNPADFYSLSPPVGMRTKEEVAAVITVTDVELPPEDAASLPEDYAYGFLKSVSITEPGAYYQESDAWDGVATPFSHVRLVRRGSGYAKRARTQPAVTAGNSGEMAVTLDEMEDSCGLPYWEIDSVEPSGTGYVDGSRLLIQTVATVSTAARIAVHTREQPTVNVAAGFGTATFAATLVKSGPSVSGWSEVFNIPQGVVGATWAVQSIQVTEPGTGYPPNSTLVLSVTTPHTGAGGTATARTDENGAVQSATVTNSGAYYRDRGVPQEFSILRRGVYYQENDHLPPYIGLEEVSVIQTLPSAGSGAVIKATVNEDTASADFGKIESVEVEEPGADYLMRSGPINCKYQYLCPEHLQSVEATLQDGELRVSLGRVVTSSDAQIPIDEDEAEYRWGGLFLSQDKVEDCASLPEGVYVSAYDGPSGEITLSAGGKYDAKEPCCFCPCNMWPYPLDLVPCGIESLTVEVDIQVEPDEEDSERCVGLTETLSLVKNYRNSVGGYWQTAISMDGWYITAALTCGATKKYAVEIVAQPDGTVCSSIGQPPGESDIISMVVELPSARDESGSRCCITDGAELVVTKHAATATATVTLVEIEE